MKQISGTRAIRSAGAAAIVPILLLGTPACLAGAGDHSSQPQTASQWHIHWPTYVWAAGVDGTARTLPPLPESNVDISFSDSIEALKDFEAGLITTVYARHDRLLLMADINWMRLDPHESLTFNGQDVDLNFYSESLAFMGGVGYRLVDGNDYIVDAYVGAKFWYMDNSAKVKPAVVTPDHVDEQETWVDGIVGGQILANITDCVYANALGFAGAGGSEFFGDMYAGVGYRVNEKWDVFAGYRAQRVEHENGSFRYDVTQQGPLLGFAAKL